MRCACAHACLAARLSIPPFLSFSRSRWAACSAGRVRRARRFHLANDGSCSRVPLPRSVDDSDHADHRAAPGQHLDVLCQSASRAFPNCLTHQLTRARAKGVNCCADVRLLLDSGPDGGFCPPVGECRGFNGTCGELPAQFATVAVLPDYPNGLQDYTCTAFPNDDNSVDSFIVGLISLAIGASCRGCVGILWCSPMHPWPHSHSRDRVHHNLLRYRQ